MITYDNMHQRQVQFDEKLNHVYQFYSWCLRLSAEIKIFFSEITSTSKKHDETVVADCTRS
eukprot:m.82904 g.82904  ORF g.82904 m.82904 type:complete len:61 (-) comp25570_c1_seq1:555-737(-)